MTLDKLKRGEKALVKGIEADSSMKQRFLDMGFMENAVVECVLESPGRDPKAYFIKGAQIAIRNEDAKKIKMKPALDSENVENEEENE